MSNVNSKTSLLDFNLNGFICYMSGHGSDSFELLKVPTIPVIRCGRKGGTNHPMAGVISKNENSKIFTIKSNKIQ